MGRNQLRRTPARSSWRSRPKTLAVGGVEDVDGAEEAPEKNKKQRPMMIRQSPANLVPRGRKGRPKERPGIGDRLERPGRSGTLRLGLPMQVMLTTMLGQIAKRAFRRSPQNQIKQSMQRQRLTSVGKLTASTTQQARARAPAMTMAREAALTNQRAKGGRWKHRHRQDRKWSSPIRRKKRMTRKLTRPRVRRLARPRPRRKRRQPQTWLSAKSFRRHPKLSWKKRLCSISCLLLPKGLWKPPMTQRQQKNSKGLCAIPKPACADSTSTGPGRLLGCTPDEITVTLHTTAFPCSGWTGQCKWQLLWR